MFIVLALVAAAAAGMGVMSHPKVATYIAGGKELSGILVASGKEGGVYSEQMLQAEKKKNKDLKKENERLKGEVEKLKGEETKFKKKEQELQKENEEQREKIKTLTNENQDLKDKNKKLEGENEERKAEIEKLKAENKKLEEENKELKKESERLKEKWKANCRITKVLDWNWFKGWYEIHPQDMGTFKTVEIAKKFAGKLDENLSSSQCQEHGNAYVAGYYLNRAGEKGDYYYYPGTELSKKLRAKYD